MNRAKKLLRNRSAAPHTVKQPRRAQLRSHAGADGRNQQRQADDPGHGNAARNAGNVAEYVLVSELREDAKVPAEMREA